MFKRFDGMRVHLNDLHVEDGFNLRTRGPELDKHIDNIRLAILAGEPIAPIEVRVSDDGRVIVVDGHCRREAYILAVEDGAPIEWLDIVKFSGNDVDRVARIITSQEGRKLTALELARGYKRLAAFRMEPDAIAKRFNKSRQHVDQMLILANANADVHQLVADNKVSAAIAVDAVREHGEGAGAYLAGELEKAEVVGKKKVTAATISGPKVSAKVLQELADEVDAFVAELPTEAHQRLKTFQEQAEAAGGPELSVSVPAAALLALLTEFSTFAEARDKATEKYRAKCAKAAQLDIEDAA